MPIYEYECGNCNAVSERIFSTIKEAQMYDYSLCAKCGGYSKRILSPTEFKVVGFSAKNGYNLPNYNDVINADGHAKEEWGKD